MNPLIRSLQPTTRVCKQCATRLGLKSPFIRGSPLQKRFNSPPNNFHSIVDNPPVLVRSNQKHGPGLIILAIMPITAFLLGTWQIKRLEQKTELITRYEDQLCRPPLPLPGMVDPDAVHEFEYRRILATGKFRHDQEMLVGPRIRDGVEGYQVFTPLERGPGESTILVSRGWIAKQLVSKAVRRKASSEALPEGIVTVEGLLRAPFKKNTFTPDNKPERGEFFFPDIAEMARLTGAQPIFVEETMPQDLTLFYEREDKGIPIGRAAEVNLRNNHVQYIFTWYALAAATSIMLYMVIRKPPADASKRIRRSTNW